MTAPCTRARGDASSLALLLAKVRGDRGEPFPALIARVFALRVLGPTQRRPVVDRVSRVYVCSGFHEHLDRLQRARPHGVMQGSGMRIKVGANTIQVDAEVNHRTERLGLAVESGEDKSELLVSRACGMRETPDVVPTSQTKRRRQSQPGPSLHEVLPGAWLRDKVGGALDGFFQQPYLLWFVAEDPVRNGKLPRNIAQVTRTIIHAAEREGVDSLREQLEYALRLVSWSWIARECDVQIELIDVLIDAGASSNGNPDNALVNGNFAAAAVLLKRAGYKCRSTEAASRGRATRPRRPRRFQYFRRPPMSIEGADRQPR